MRTKIDYGIDLGTTNSAIARMENGKPVILKSDVQMDTLPSCIAVTPRKSIIQGVAAAKAYRTEKLRTLELNNDGVSNAYLEFKTTMGTDIPYPSSFLNKEFTSEELSAEILLKLKSFVKDENVNSIVITVPARFKVPQNEATIKAGKLAGFEVVELLQEPIAASIAYGLDAKNKDGIWLVFDFGGGTFDVALVKVVQGVMTVIDTAGDNNLGGKNLDLAMVDKLIIPYLDENYSIKSFLKEPKKEILRNAMKGYAEDAKVQLSDNPTTDIATFPGDIRATDDEGTEFNLNMTISQEQLAEVFSPIYQKAIDITKKILTKNNLKGSQLECLILVGGPTYSPIVQNMLKEQITENVIAKNQMTSVAIGAALYASTKEIGVVAPPPPVGTIALDLKYDAAVVGEEVRINVKLAQGSSKKAIPENLFVVIDRDDKVFKSDKKQISERASLIDLLLNKDTSNYFTINLTDDKGNKLECQPNNFTILEGITTPHAPLPYAWGIEVWNEQKKLSVFEPLKGLEKNQIQNGAVGISNKLKIPKQITGGKVTDVLRIPLYQGEDDAAGKSSFHSNHVVDVIITGETIPGVLPANSELEVTLKFDNNGTPTCSAFFPLLNHTEEIKVVIEKSAQVDGKWLLKEIKSDIQKAEALNDENPKPIIAKCISDLNILLGDFKNEEGNENGKIRILDDLRKIRLIIEGEADKVEWPKTKQELKDSYYKAEEIVEQISSSGLGSNLNMQKVNAQLHDFNTKVDQIIIAEDSQMAKETIENIDDFIRAIIGGVMPDDGEREANFIEYADDNFSTIIWINASRARENINQAKSNINNGGSLQQLKQLCQNISDLIDRTDPRQPTDIPQT
ncbi:MAG: Hsp70 family protein [Bacteroidetes bacterium]|nr:Hsp70 family protein [Bacteroidota bacterium]